MIQKYKPGSILKIDKPRPILKEQSQHKKAEYEEQQEFSHRVYPVFIISQKTLEPSTS